MNVNRKIGREKIILNVNTIDIQLKGREFQIIYKKQDFSIYCLNEMPLK